MILKLLNYFLIIVLLQSCSGGRIGNFLELSFRNIEEEKSKGNSNNLNSEKFQKNKKNFKDSNKAIININKKDFSKAFNIKNPQKKENLKSDEINKRQKKIIKKNIIQDQNKKVKSNYDPQSYRVILILKAVDPTAPSQQFSNVLKNANILFEIEKIERFKENDSKNFQ